jgi:hypothetical protein
LRSRRLDLEEPQPLEVIPTEEQKQDHHLKNTPRKKQLATKVKKDTPTKDGN